MKTKKVVQARFIDGLHGGHEACEEFNRTMLELAEFRPTYERNGDSFWIFFTVETEESETLAEECELKGEKAQCNDCPYIMRDLNRFGNIDVRKKWATCGKNGQRVSIERAACEEYYTAAGRR